MLSSRFYVSAECKELRGTSLLVEISCHRMAKDTSFGMLRRALARYTRSDLFSMTMWKKYFAKLCHCECPSSLPKSFAACTIFYTSKQEKVNAQIRHRARHPRRRKPEAAGASSHLAEILRCAQEPWPGGAMAPQLRHAGQDLLCLYRSQ